MVNPIWKISENSSKSMGQVVPYTHLCQTEMGQDKENDKDIYIYRHWITCAPL